MTRFLAYPCLGNALLRSPGYGRRIASALLLADERLGRGHRGEL